MLFQVIDEYSIKKGEKKEENIISEISVIRKLHIPPVVNLYVNNKHKMTKIHETLISKMSHHITINTAQDTNIY